ncbi:hypothetical protein ABZ297_11115 [Nonomuraea sp. NPDC005983]|uniref:hypothetical protein n=1 Tax=Nonomuraea sp. NPDC005983 TaxID=3155595 RepID=UPI0033A56384
MASGPSDPPRRPPGDDDPRPEDAHGQDEPRIRHTPPGPTDDRARGLPLASPWGMPPFSAPTPEDEPPDPPKGRRPYSSPTSETEAPRRSRRVTHPDKLVAGTPTRPRPETEAQPPHREPPYHLPLPEEAEPEAAEPDEPPGGEEPPGEDGVRRVGRPPGGRPTRPDLLVASGPARPGGSGGRHHRGPAPAAVRRSSPVARRRLARPLALVTALVLVVAAGVVGWQWWSSSQRNGLRLAAGTGRSGDDLFTVPSAGDGSNQKLNDMASVGRAVVAVGSDTTSPTPRPLFLFSPDGGRNWQLGQVTGTSTPTVQRVVGGGGLWLASGGDGAGGERGLWTSSDGFSWAAVEQTGPAAFRPGDQIADIARTASGFVAVGRATREDGGSAPAAWQSADGRAWQRVQTRGLGVRELTALVAKGDTVVAAGQPEQGAGSRVVRSADGGKSWQPTSFQLPEAMPRIGSLAVLPKQFVLAPIRQRTVSGDVRVYCSPTGARWSQCGSIRGLSGESPGVESLISYASGVAAISQANLGKYTVLTSTDARTWTRRADLGNLAGATLRGFTIAEGGTLFAGGDQAAADVDNQLVLISAPAKGASARVRLDRIDGLSRIARQTNRLAAHEGRYVAVGSASGDAGIWTSLNWQTWTSISLGGAHQQTLDDVAYGRRGWLAVGGTQTDTSATEPLIVSSQDGRAWKRVPGTGDLARPQDHPYLAAHAVAADDKGYVLVGEDRSPSGTAAALWFTPDLRAFTRSKKLPQGGSDVHLHDVTATSSGFVAVGGAGHGDQESGVVWFSEDGVNWKARKHVTPPDATSAGFRQIAAYQGKLVAIGTAQTSGTHRAFAAVSDDDGVTWRTSWLPTGQAAAVFDLAAADDGLVAVGWNGTSADGDSAAWTSQDGLTWNRQDPTGDRLAGPGMQWLAAVTIAGSEVVALGRSTTYDADHLILWTSTLSR